MTDTVGYGVVVRNTPVDIQSSVAYSELSSLGVVSEIDLVRSDCSARPRLEYLLETLDPGTIIQVYSIDTLLKGDSSRAVEYYSAILDKGLGLAIYDFSGAIARLSPFSSVRLGWGKSVFVRKNVSNALLVASFSDYIKTAKPNKKTDVRRTDDRFLNWGAFKEIYFAYETYQIDQATTLSLLAEYCGIETKITFWNTARDYERTIHYYDDFDEYAKMVPEILSLPKRCGGIPAEYSEILGCMYLLKNKTCSEIEFKDIPFDDPTFEDASYCEDEFADIPYYAREYAKLPERYKEINVAMRHLDMFGDYQVFLRWELLDQKRPKPRKQIRLNFDLKEFMDTYKPNSILSNRD